MSSTPHYNNGKVLLKDSNTDNWYYLMASILDDEAYVQPGQDVVEVPTSNNYAENIILKAPDGSYYSVTLYSNEGQVFSSETLLETAQSPNRVFLRSADNNLLYELVMRPDTEANNYLALVLASSNITTDLCTPFKLISNTARCTSEDRSISSAVRSTDNERSISAVSAVCEREILV